METKVEKLEKENKLLQENYNQLRKKLNFLFDITDEKKTSHQNTIKKLRGEMKTKVDKVEKENKLLQENYNQLKDKLHIVSNVIAKELKVVHETVKGMEIAFTGGLFFKLFNKVCSDEPRFSSFTNTKLLSNYLHRCDYTKNIRIPKVNNNFKHFKNFDRNCKNRKSTYIFIVISGGYISSVF